MQKQLAAFICLVLLCGSASALADPFDAVRAAIRRDLATEQEGGQQVPSITVAVAKNGKIIWEEGFGWADRERRVAATPDTSYSLASISKTMTGLALMTLVKAGKIDLDRPVNDYLGSAKLTARVGDAAGATVRRVANHSSGLPEYCQYFYENEPWTPPDPDETIRRFGVLMSPPGERFEYSNLGYGALSTVIARAAGQSFADYLRQAVFLPLGMTRTSVGGEPALAPYQAVRYGIDGLPIAPYETNHAGASAIYASAHDLARLGLFVLKTHLPDQAAILSDAEVDAMLRPTMPMGPGKGYGVGWETSTRDGVAVYAHTGGMPGVQTELRVVPSEKLVVVVLCNAEVWDLPGTIADQIMATLIPHWQAPPDEAPPPSAPFAPGPDLVGVWKGRVATYAGDLPITLTVFAGGDVHAKLGDQREVLVNHPHVSRDGYLRGILSASLGLEDGVRRPYVVGLDLKLHGNGLSGEILAQADDRGVAPTHGLYPAAHGHPQPTGIQTDAFKFAQWAELVKQP
ncbi:MAG: serine hydrolase [Azospirillaceae bacterium]|nr:serine hydrolase [Azospirillaceae bacterium]